MRRCTDFLDAISRRKPWDVRSLHQTELTRNLNVIDIIGIGIGSCAGLSVYVTSAYVAKHEAGAAVVLSVLVAGLSALLSGMCHMELATRLPRSGTGYTFCYVTFGELLAFVIGWNVILENVITGALAAKALWQYVEHMYNSTGNSNVTYIEGETEGQVFVTSPDIFPCCLVIAITCLTLTTIKVCAVANFVLMCVSGLVVVAFVCVGFFHVDSENWNSPPGFFVHGFGGIMSGAALLMSSFASIDNLASCSEEIRTPCKSLPTAFNFVMAIVFTVIFLTTLALTLATPWQQLSDNAALARAYEIKGIFAGNYIIGSGAIFGLLPVVMGSFLHPVRIMYSMSGDKLLPRMFSRIALFGVPVCSHFVTGVLVSFCALLLEFSTLLEMSSIATILQFISSAIILLYIRYQPVPTGISREYTDLDQQAIFEDAPATSSFREFKEISPKLVLLANGEHTILRNNEFLYSSNVVSPCVSNNMPRKVVRAKCERCNYLNCPSVNDSSFQHSQTTMLSSSTPLQNPKQKSTSFAGSEKDRLQNGHADSICVNTEGYGLSNSCSVGCPLKDNSCAKKQENSCAPKQEIRTNGRTSNSTTLTEKVHFFQAGLHNSLIALSPWGKNHADEQTWKLMRYFLLIYILSSSCFAVSCQAWYDDSTGTWWAVTLSCISLVLMAASALVIARQPQNKTPVYFKTPYVPIVPLLSVTINTLLLTSLPAISWTRFALWLITGLLIYTFYSRYHSIHREMDDQEVVLFDVSQMPSTTIN